MLQENLGDLFQFLIGSLKTWSIRRLYWSPYVVSIPHRQSKNRPANPHPNQDSLVSIPHRQSKNKRCLRILSRKSRFQFLIGSLKTQKNLPRPQLPPPVSIPHRQSKNLRPLSSWLGRVDVSIPHRQSKNDTYPFHPPPCLQVSIPHRQSKNRFLINHVFNPVHGFNSS